MNTLSEIQKKIRKALEEAEKLRLISKHLEDINIRLTNARSELKVLDQKLEDELKDIERLESLGVTSVFYKVLGNKEEQLDKERQEYLEASLKYKEFKETVDLLEFEKSVLRKKMGGLPALEKEIEILKEAREKEIMKSDNQLASKLRDIVMMHDQMILLNKDFSEAIEEGEKSQKMLSVVLSYLKKARDWGRWDMQGKRKGNIMKHQAIDKAMKNISKAQHQLNIFERELNDLGRSDLKLKIRTSQFDRFTDYFFDNLISDWIVQQKIKSTIASIDGSFDQVRRLCMSLEKEQVSIQKKISELEHERNAIILS